MQKGRETERRSRRHVARFILVGLYTGTRAGAICAASFQPAIGRGHIDLDRGIFYRRAQGASPTKKRQPAAMLPPRLLAHIRRWAEKGIAARAVVEFEGRPVKSVRKAFARAAKDAGLAGVTPHVLRHKAASWAMQGGANIYASADYLGMTIETLERVYGHLRPDHHAGVVAAMTGKR
jgi:integrase